MKCKSSIKPSHLLTVILALALGPALAQYAYTGERTVTLIMGDIYFEIEGQDRGEALTATAGESITFIVENVGGMPHNVQFGRDFDAQTRRYQAELFPGFAGIDLDPGQKARLTLQLPDEPGEWEIGCLVLGHYEANQVLGLIIE